MDKKGRILLVEDEENFGAVLQNYLELSGYQVDWAVDGNVGISKFRTGSYIMCLLDVMMPFKDGFTLATEIRNIDKEIPIIFLTAKGDKADQVKGYRIGADDYLTKPFDSELLLLKMNSILKRAAGRVAAIPSKVELGGYVFSPSTRILTFEEEESKLSPKEAQLLTMLCKYTNDVMPRAIALHEIWKNDDYFATRSMDVYVAKLRKRLNKDTRIDIENIHATGFHFRVPE